MTGLINLIADNISKLIVLPILSLLIIGLTYFMSKNNEKKIVKFYPAFILTLLGIAIEIIAGLNLTSDTGLNLAWIGLILFTNGIVGIFFAIIIDLYRSIKGNYSKVEKVNKNGKK